MVNAIHDAHSYHLQQNDTAVRLQGNGAECVVNQSINGYDGTCTTPATHAHLHANTGDCRDGNVDLTIDSFPISALTATYALESTELTLENARLSCLSAK